MSRFANNNEHLGCDFCNNFAVAICDAWIASTGDVCSKKICHRCRRHLAGFDSCPNHHRALNAEVHRAKQVELNQPGLFGQFQSQGGDAVKS